MHRLHVFAGTSISLRDAHALWGNEWTVRPPIRRGDLEELCAASARSPTPRLIVILDGCFFTSAAVSIMEIREAIEQGWTVVGASSIGALRAVECRPLGMIGFGGVFRWLSLYKVEDDDEVAQTINPETYEPTSDAMVDIRAITKYFERQHVLTRAERSAILSLSKSQYFPDRSVRTVLQHLTTTPSSDLRTLVSSFTPPKRRDAYDCCAFVRRRYSYR
jgi:hypothetical protein